MFLNDVFACAGDVARLLAHETAHLACGLDFDRPHIAQMDRQVRVNSPRVGWVHGVARQGCWGGAT